MDIKILGDAGFRYLQLAIEPGEELIAESDAMASMDTDLNFKPELNGGLVSGLLRKFLSSETLFINRFKNNSDKKLRLTITNPTPGSIVEIKLDNQTYSLQPGAFICSNPEIKRKLKYAGIASFIGGEGLFKTEVSGSGSVFIGCYGALSEKEIKGEYIIDTGHLVAYPPSIKMKVQLSNGILGSFFSGEGMVSRIEGKGTVIMQSRSLDGFAAWLNPRL